LGVRCFSKLDCKSSKGEASLEVTHFKISRRLDRARTKNVVVYDPTKPRSFDGETQEPPLRLIKEWVAMSSWHQLFKALARSELPPSKVS
jgi:hypothetical protein